MLGKLIENLKEGGFLKTLISIKNHIILNFYRKFLSRNGLIVKDIHGYKMYLDISYPGVARELVVYGTREKLEVQIVKKELKSGMNILDIGANIGYYALMEASIVGPKGKVYAIEPEPRNFELLAKNIKLNDYGNIIETYPFAVSNKNGAERLYLSEFANLHTLVAPDNTGMGTGSFLDVKTIRVDDFLNDKLPVSLIRMDIEGFECEAIDGMLRTLEQSELPIKLLIEVHPYFYNETNRNFRSRLIKLNEMGFRAKYLVSAGVAAPDKIVNAGYKPVSTVRECEFSRGLYTNIAMQDLLEFINYRPKIVRAVLLEK